MNEKLFEKWRKFLIKINKNRFIAFKVTFLRNNAVKIGFGFLKFAPHLLLGLKYCYGMFKFAHFQFLIVL